MMNAIQTATVATAVFLVTLTLYAAAIANNALSFGVPFLDNLTLFNVSCAGFTACFVSVMFTGITIVIADHVTR